MTFPTAVFDIIVLRHAVEQVIDDLCAMKNSVSERTNTIGGDVYNAEEFKDMLQERMNALYECLAVKWPMYPQVPDWAWAAVERKITAIVESVIQAGFDLKRGGETQEG